jgi:hypothetical protein
MLLPGLDINTGMGKNACPLGFMLAAWLSPSLCPALSRSRLRTRT